MAQADEKPTPTDQDRDQVRHAGAGLDGAERIKRTFFLLLAALTLVLVYLVARAFLLSILLAALSAAVFQPVHRRILGKLPDRPGMAAGLSLLLFFLIILIPFAAVVFLVTENAVDLARFLRDNETAIRAWFQDLETAVRGSALFGGAWVSDLFDSARLTGALRDVGTSVAEQVAGFASRFARSLVMIIVYIYALYFLLRDGVRAMKSLEETIPLPGPDRDAVTRKFRSVASATLKSTFVVGGVQGILGGVTFLVLGIPGPVLWGVGFMFLAAIPSLGAVLIWLPASIVLLAAGEYVKAVIMLVLGGGVIPLADYLIRPRIVGQDIRLHPLLVLIGVLGGIIAFGVWGLLIGPLVMSVAETLRHMFVRIYKRELRAIE